MLGPPLICSLYALHGFSLAFKFGVFKSKYYYLKPAENFPATNLQREEKRRRRLPEISSLLMCTGSVEYTLSVVVYGCT